MDQRIYFLSLNVDDILFNVLVVGHRFKIRICAWSIRLLSVFMWTFIQAHTLRYSLTWEFCCTYLYLFGFKTLIFFGFLFLFGFISLEMNKCLWLYVFQNTHLKEFLARYVKHSLKEIQRFRKLLLFLELTGVFLCDLATWGSPLSL